jgi:translation initiation factor IF-3
MAHPELGSRILDQALADIGPLAKVESQARLEGRNMTMVLAPDKKAQAAALKERQVQRQEHDSQQRRDEDHAEDEDQ